MHTQLIKGHSHRKNITLESLPQNIVIFIEQFIIDEIQMLYRPRYNVIMQQIPKQKAFWFGRGKNYGNKSYEEELFYTLPLFVGDDLFALFCMYRTESYYANKPPPDIVGYFEDEWEDAWSEDDKDMTSFMVEKDINFGIRHLHDNEFVEIPQLETSDIDY